MKKICANCGHVCDIDNSRGRDLSEHLSGASKLYYDLWNFDIERCPNCNYSSMDISKKENVKLNEYKMHALLGDKVINELNECRPNQIFNYLLASIYYEELGDTLTQAKCVLQAGDWLFFELPYFIDEFLDEDDRESVEFYQNYANKFYKEAITLLEKYLDKNQDDYKAKLLLAGVLQDMEGADKFKSHAILRSIDESKLSSDEKEIYSFLCQDIE